MRRQRQRQRQRQRPPRVQVRENPQPHPGMGPLFPTGLCSPTRRGALRHRVARRKRNVTPDASQAIPSQRPAQCDDSDSDSDSDSDRPVCRCAKTHSHIPGWARSSQQVCAHRRDGGRCVTAWLAGSATIQLMPVQPFPLIARLKATPPRSGARNPTAGTRNAGPLFLAGLSSSPVCDKGVARCPRGKPTV